MKIVSLCVLTPKKKNLLKLNECSNNVDLCILLQVTRRRNLLGRFSPSSSSDVAPSLDESIESGPLSDLQSEEDEGRRSAEHQPPLTLPPLRGRECASLVQQLLEDIHSHDKDPDIWKKIEVFLSSLHVICLCSGFDTYVAHSLYCHLQVWGHFSSHENELSRSFISFLFYCKHPASH